MNTFAGERWPLIWQQLLFVLVYFIAAQVGIFFALPPTSVSVFWPPSGLAVALFLLWKPQVAWKNVMLGYLLSLGLYHYWQGQLSLATMTHVCVSAVGTTLQALAAYLLMHRALPVKRFLYSQAQIIRFWGASLLACLIAPSLGTLSLLVLKHVSLGKGAEIWLTWWIGDVLGVLLFAPAMISLMTATVRSLEPQVLIRAGYFSLITGLVFYIVFINPITVAYDLIWVIYPLLTWCAFLFGPRGAVLGNLAMAIFAIYSTQLGNFSAFLKGLPPLQSLLLLQIYVGFMALMSLHFAAFLCEREETLKELHEANLSRGLFLAKMSHELRTPLNAILGFTQLVLKEQRLDSKHQQYLERVRENGRHLMKLINDILDLSKIEAGKMRVSLHTVPLQTVLDTVLQHNEALFKEKNLRLELQVPPEPVNYQLDIEKFRQVLENLLSNAVKFSRQDGLIRISLQIDGQLRPLYLEIADQGIGIPPERQSQIFKAFEQAENHTSRTYGGTGLGLTIAQELCALMQLRLILASSDEQGSRFQILFVD